MSDSDNDDWTAQDINKAQDIVDGIVRKVAFFLHTIQHDPTFFSQLPSHQQTLSKLLTEYSQLQSHLPSEIFYPTTNAIDGLRQQLIDRERQGPPPIRRHAPPRVKKRTQGRPSYELPEDKIRRMHREGKTVRYMAFVLGSSVSTIDRWKKVLKLQTKSRKTVMVDDEVERTIIRIREQGNQSLGEKGIMTALQLEGLVLPRAQIRRALYRVDGPGRHARWQQVRKKRRYAVPFPLALIHIDGNLKLIRWLFVLHGGIDGYSRRIFYLQAATNNEAMTVLKAFQDGVNKLGWPSRVRADYGGENLRVKDLMEEVRGEGRGSFIQGRSTGNQRIERFWLDAGKWRIDTFRIVFQDLEDRNLLDIDSVVDLWCLHTIFLPVLNEALRTCAEIWDHHRISRVGFSPNELWEIGLIQARNAGYQIQASPTDSQPRLPDENLPDYTNYGRSYARARLPQQGDQHVRVEQLQPVLTPEEEAYALEVVGVRPEVVDFPWAMASYARLRAAATSLRARRLVEEEGE